MQTFLPDSRLNISRYLLDIITGVSSRYPHTEMPCLNLQSPQKLSHIYSSPSWQIVTSSIHLFMPNIWESPLTFFLSLSFHSQLIRKFSQLHLQTISESSHFSLSNSGPSHHQVSCGFLQQFLPNLHAYSLPCCSVFSTQPKESFNNVRHIISLLLNTLCWLSVLLREEFKSFLWPTTPFMIQPCYFSDFIIQGTAPRSSRSSHTSLCTSSYMPAMLPRQAGHLYSWLSLPEILFTHKSEWLTPISLSNVCPDITFRMRSTLTTLFKIVAPTLAPLMPVILIYLSLLLALLIFFFWNIIQPLFIF